MECIQSCSVFFCRGYLTEIKKEVSKGLFRSFERDTAKIHGTFGAFFFFFLTTRVENNDIYESSAQSLW